MGMQANNFLHFLRTRPFRPFRLTLTDGRTYTIQHPELMMVGRSTLEIGIPTPDLPPAVFDHRITISLLHVMQVETLPDAEAS